MILIFYKKSYIRLCGEIDFRREILICAAGHCSVLTNTSKRVILIIKILLIICC